MPIRAYSDGEKLAQITCRRLLPHWQPDGKKIFITTRLFNSLPQSAIKKLLRQKTILEQQPPRPDESPRDRALRLDKRMFALTDEALAAELRKTDCKSTKWLANHNIADMVEQTFLQYQGIRYTLHRYTIMPNHFHLLIEPLVISRETVRQPIIGNTREELSYWAVSKIMKDIKGKSARMANKMLNRTGLFWQEESYDHWVRDHDEYLRIVRYIDENPVKAGLCEKPEDWPWSRVGRANFCISPTSIKESFDEK